MEKSNLSHVNISISIVSHAQIDLVESLLLDIAEHCQTAAIEVILTLNLKETVPLALDEFSFPMTVIRNKKTLGFSANHNQAFQQASGQFYCVMNPDIRMNENPFPHLLASLQNTSIGVVSPLVLNEFGNVEDCARRFPSPLIILCKAFGRCKESDYDIDEKTIFPDWVAGMFMLFPASVFKQINGFDEKYFLYYEDVDICARLRLMGYQVAMSTETKVIHLAQRSSHHSLPYFKWHLMSMMRFFCSFAFYKMTFLKYKRPCSQVLKIFATKIQIESKPISLLPSTKHCKLLADYENSRNGC